MTYTIVRDGFFFRVVASNGWRSTALTSMSAAALVKRRLEARTH